MTEVLQSLGCRQTVVGMETDYYTPTSYNILRGKFADLFYKIKMHLINVVLVGSVSYFSRLRIILQAL